jgi:hypothetical protein
MLYGSIATINECQVDQVYINPSSCCCSSSQLISSRLSINRVSSFIFHSIIPALPDQTISPLFNMRLSITSSIAIMAGLAAHGSAFVIDTFNGNNCDSVVQTGVNIWDNTCATWPDGFQSFRITVWGGSHQRGYFFADDNCGSLPAAIKAGYVDSTTYDFVLGGCYNFDGASANAIASYSS